MWVYKQALISMKMEQNLTKLYFLASTITSFIIFTAINICNNDILVNMSEVMDKNKSFFIAGTPIEIVKQTNLVILLLIAIGFTIVCSMYYLRKKSKEVAYLTLNGGTTVDHIRFLLFQNGVILIASFIAGSIISIILNPLVNYIMYSLTGNFGPLFVIKLNSFSLTFGFLATELLALCIINTGYFIKKGVKELIDTDDNPNPVSKGIIKFPYQFFVVLYIIPILFTIFAGNTQGAEIAIPLLSYLAIPGTYGILRYVIPKIIEFIKKKKFRYDFKKLMYLSNVSATSKKSILYILSLQASITLFLGNFSEFSSYTGVKENLILCILGVSILVSMALVFSSIVDILDNKTFFNQMRAFGYTDEEVYDVVRKELICYFMLVVMAGLLQIFCIYIVFFMANFITMQYFILLALALFTPLLVVAIALIFATKIFVKKNLVGGF